MKADPKKLLEGLCKEASPRKEQSLRLIYLICEEQVNRGSHDYSVVTIGKLSNERGGPSAAAIRNKPGEDYRALIKVFADSVQGFSKKKMNTPKSSADDLLEGISDPVLRVRINLIFAELESLRAQLLATRHLANKNAVLDMSVPKSNDSKEIIGSKDIGLTLQEVSALEAAISPLTFNHWGWKVDKAGRISTETGQVVFRAGFESAIKKTVKFAADF